MGAARGMLSSSDRLSGRRKSLVVSVFLAIVHLKSDRPVEQELFVLR